MTRDDKDRLVQQLMRHEDFRQFPYRCTAGKLTIGIGRNLEDKGISLDEARLMLENDLHDADEDCRLYLGAEFWAALLDEHPARAAVLLNMAFNLGRPRLSTFKRLKVALYGREWDEAAEEMLSSKWAQQVGSRAQELAEQMESGGWDDA